MKRETRLRAARNLHDPDVRSPCLGVVAANRQALPIGGKLGIRIVTRRNRPHDLTAAIEPDELRAHHRDGAVGENAVARSRKRSVPGRPRAAHASHALRDRYRLARQLQASGVERLGGERALPHEEEITGRRVQRARLGGGQAPSFLLPECSEVDLRRGSLFAFDEEQIVAAVRQERRPLVAISPAASVVSALGAPPEAATRMRGEFESGLKRIAPSELHVPP